MWPKFQILGLPNISGTAKDTNIKFCMLIDGKEYWTKNKKIKKIEKIEWQILHVDRR